MATLNGLLVQQLVDANSSANAHRLLARLKETLRSRLYAPEASRPAVRTAACRAVDGARPAAER